MKTRTIILLLLGCTFFGVGLVSVLFLMSEEKMQRNNAFQRRYPHHPSEKIKELDIQFNSYYIAGFYNDSIYLGNHMAPSHLLVTDLDLTDTIHIRLDITESERYPFSNVNAKINDSNIYLMDGTVPIIYKGKIKERIVSPYIKESAYFSRISIIDSTGFVVKSMSNKTSKYVLGKIETGGEGSVRLCDDLLEAQIDGVFDTDGMILNNYQNKQLIYVYYYRNEYFITDYDLNLIEKRKTIDTISKAQLEVISYSTNNTRTLKGNQVIVNSKSATYGNYLFINSPRLGKYESKDNLKHASIIDVYNLTDGSYLLSFYLYHHNRVNIKEFKVYKNKIYALIENEIIVYELKDTYFDL